MASQAEVFVKNVEYDSVQVFREQPDGSRDLDITLAKGADETIFLADPDVKLGIIKPGGVDVDDFPIKVKSAVDLGVSYSIQNSTWTVRTQSNSFPPPVPTTVNINIGEDIP